MTTYIGLPILNFNISKTKIILHVTLNRQHKLFDHNGHKPVIQIGLVLGLTRTVVIC